MGRDLFNQLLGQGYDFFTGVPDSGLKRVSKRDPGKRHFTYRGTK